MTEGTVQKDEKEKREEGKKKRREERGKREEKKYVFMSCKYASLPHENMGGDGS
jgi:hypothetical protein